MADNQSGKDPTFQKKERRQALIDSQLKAVSLDVEKKAEERRQEVLKKFDAEEKTYREKEKELKTAWDAQHEKVKQLHEQLQALYGGEAALRQLLQCAVCQQVEAYSRELRADLEKRLGPEERAYYQAEKALAQEKVVLDGWTTLAKTIKDELDAVDKLREEACKLRGCTENLLALYIFYFELLPRHLQLNPDPANGWKDYREPLVSLCGFPSESPKGPRPHLVGPDAYYQKLLDALKEWTDAWNKQAAAKFQHELLPELKKELEEANKREKKHEFAKLAFEWCKPGQGAQSSPGAAKGTQQAQNSGQKGSGQPCGQLPSQQQQQGSQSPQQQQQSGQQQQQQQNPCTRQEGV